MDSIKIKGLIAKALLKEISNEEQEYLDKWLNESEENKNFFESLHSEVYLKNAIGDRNRILRDERWNRLKKETIRKNYNKVYLQVLQFAAIFVLPLMIGGLIWYMTESVENHGKISLAQQHIQVGGSKAVVTLSTGQKYNLFGDSTVRVDDGLSKMVNQKDTLSFTSSDDTVISANSYTVIEIPRGGEYIVRLEDGTVVYLNSESELRVPVNFGAKKREVCLKGEAYFNVQYEAKRHFTVRTDKANISVLGTEFAVRNYEGEQELFATLVKGSVEVKKENDVRRIIPGEQVKVNKEGKITVNQVKVEEHIAWTLGRIIFVNARLDDIMKELQRWYNFNFSYADLSMKDFRFTMDVIKYKDVTDIFELIEKIGKVSFVMREKDVFLK